MLNTGKLMDWTAMTVVVSAAVLLDAFPSPPPATEARFTIDPATLGPTLTATVIGGQLASGDRASDRVQLIVFSEQVQPVPLREAAVSPAGRVSVTVTAPADERLPTLLTVI